MRACALSCVHLLVTLWTVACQSPLSLGFSRQEYWSGLPFPLPGDLPDPGIEPLSPVLAGRFFTPELPGKSYLYINKTLKGNKKNANQVGTSGLNKQQGGKCPGFSFCLIYPGLGCQRRQQLGNESEHKEEKLALTSQKTNERSLGRTQNF